ncbi:MAG: hypothetical protein JWR83_3348 [Aeromicrobium sp.]|nr:hypothetical protein [Aeromicrobium sp.]
MESKPIHTVNDIPGMLGTLPALFGFRPEESILAICTHGPRSRFGFRLRLDTPEPENVDDAAMLVAQHLRNQHPDGVILIALAGRAEVADDMVERTQHHLGAIPILEAVRVHDGHYWDYNRATPTGGIPYAESSTSPVVMAAVAAGKPIYSSRRELENAYNTVNPRLLTRVQSAISGALEEIETIQTTSGKPSELGTTRDRAAAALVAATADRDQLTPEKIAWLTIAAAVVPVRDDMWATMTHQNAADHADVWRLVAVHNEGRQSVAPYTLSAFGNWLAGDGAQALIAVEHAREQDPNYTMAELIETTLIHGVDPRTWRGFTPQDGPAGQPSPSAASPDRST